MYPQAVVPEVGHGIVWGQQLKATGKSIDIGGIGFHPLNAIVKPQHFT